MNTISLPILDAGSASPSATEEEHRWHGQDPAAWHRFDHDGRSFLYVSDGSLVYEVEKSDLDKLTARLGGRVGDELVLTALGIRAVHAIGDAPPPDSPIRSLSLAIAQKCNLGCTYCYAQQGEFGGGAKAMSGEMAVRAVDLLFQNARRGDRVNLAFLGGEPLA